MMLHPGCLRGRPSSLGQPPARRKRRLVGRAGAPDAGSGGAGRRDGAGDSRRRPRWSPAVPSAEVRSRGLSRCSSSRPPPAPSSDNRSPCPWRGQSAPPASAMTVGSRASCRWSRPLACALTISCDAAAVSNLSKSSECLPGRHARTHARADVARPGGPHSHAVAAGDGIHHCRSVGRPTTVAADETLTAWAPLARSWHLVAVSVKGTLVRIFTGRVLRDGRTSSRTLTRVSS